MFKLGNEYINMASFLMFFFDKFGIHFSLDFSIIMYNWLKAGKYLDLKPDSHLPKKIVLFASLKVLLKWWKMLFISY